MGTVEGERYMITGSQLLTLLEKSGKDSIDLIRYVLNGLEPHNKYHSPIKSPVAGYLADIKAGLLQDVDKIDAYRSELRNISDRMEADILRRKTENNPDDIGYIKKTKRLLDANRKYLEQPPDEPKREALIERIKNLSSLIGEMGTHTPMHDMMGPTSTLTEREIMELGQRLTSHYYQMEQVKEHIDRGCSTPMGHDDKQLEGWDQIAGCLNKSPRTAQRYLEKDPSMPITRDPGGRPLAIETELKDWNKKANKGKK